MVEFQNTQSNRGKVVKIRWKKEYPNATNHVCIGEVVRETDAYIVVHGVTYHFRKGAPQGFTKGFKVGRSRERVRWIPWSAIALVTELSPDLDWRQSEVEPNEDGRLQLVDEAKRPVASP
jgi:hypothetical protein